MRINVRSKPSSKKEKVERISDKSFIVAVKEPPVGGKANHAIAKAVSKHLNVPSSSVRIISGHSSKNKIIEVS